MRKDPDPWNKGNEERGTKERGERDVVVLAQIEVQ